MRLSRLYVPLPLQVGNEVELPDHSAHYVRTVLRLKSGTAVVVFNGDGNEYTGHLASVSKKAVTLLPESVQRPERESALHVHVALGLSRGERMDYAIQKCTELGASSMTPLFTERSEVRLKGDRIDKRLAHWQQVAISACEQSGRLQIPEVHPPCELRDWLQTCQAPWKFVFDHRQKTSLPVNEVVGELALLTGPEGGFSEAELEAATAAGFRAVTLGQRVLRAETAPVAALSVLQWLWGDFR